MSDAPVVVHSNQAKMLWFAVGLLGSVLLGLLSNAGAAQIDPCRYRTAIAFLVPLSIGLGGLAIASIEYTRQSVRAFMGLGMIVTSMWLLYYGLGIMGAMRQAGCGGQV